MNQPELICQTWVMRQEQSHKNQIEINYKYQF